MIIREVSQSELDKLFEFFYTENGKFFAKQPYGKGGKRKHVGEEVGWDNLHGYRQFYFSGRVYMVHRVIYYLHYGIYPTLELDHINGNGMDNRPENLREVSREQNCRSFAKIRSSGRFTSKYRGVSLHKPSGLWRARMIYGKQDESLGYFESEREAALVWNYKALESGYNPEAFNQVFKEQE